MKKYYIDIGSSTIKTYSEENGQIDLIDEKSILFKNGFTAEAGVSAENIAALFSHLCELNLPNAKTFATGIWREIPAAQAARLDAASPYGFNIISHQEEAECLKRAADLDFGDKKVMIINMGGKTTEIVSRKGGYAEIKTINIGVADLLNAFPEQNEEISPVKIDDMEKFVSERLANETFDADYDFAIFTGELRFQKLTGYPHSPNKQFVDANHPVEQSLNDFIRGTERIFYELTYAQLRELMPKNPNWMSGARAGAVLPLAVFRRANIKTIVPSDLNLINGVV
ncbi:MAG: hypothetical protein LBH41_02275 [Rickettsiales bacterium]|jgi:hypothetical protein|nr:hypothetical protein [Rickettsiales bacterium]